MDEVIFLYVIKCGTYCKVGIAKDVSKRISSLQSSNPQPIELMEKFPGSITQIRAFEKKLHNELCELGIWTRGEWFRWSKKVSEIARGMAREMYDTGTYNSHSMHLLVKKEKDERIKSYWTRKRITVPVRDLQSELDKIKDLKKKFNI